VARQYNCLGLFGSEFLKVWQQRVGNIKRGVEQWFMIQLQHDSSNVGPFQKVQVKFKRKIVPA